MSLLRPADRGNHYVQASWAGTALFTVVSVAAVVSDARSVRATAVAVSLGLFALGCVAFLASYARAIQRSRTDEIGIGGLYFAAGATAPKAVRVSLNLSLAVQVVVSVTAASIRPFTTVAFGILVPVYALGLTGMWCASFGRFGARRRDDLPPVDPMGQTTDHG